MSTTGAARVGVDPVPTAEDADTAAWSAAGPPGVVGKVLAAAEALSAAGGVGESANSRLTGILVRRSVRRCSAAWRKRFCSLMIAFCRLASFAVVAAFTGAFAVAFAGGEAFFALPDVGLRVAR
jgi:hypothetical protein